MSITEELALRRLPEVVHELAGLPDPDDRLAPRLVKGSNTLWTP
jgi:hypothetical protein